MSTGLEQTPLIFKACSLDAAVRLKPRFFSCLRQPAFFGLPAVKAVSVQCAALIAVLFCVFLLGLIAQIHFSFFTLAMMQAVFSAALCARIRMAHWWRWIHFGFPLALWGMLQWHVPNQVYLVCFLISLSLYWTTFRSQVPFYPSRPSAWRSVAEFLPKNTAISMIDIGSGFGDLSMYIAKNRPESCIEGIEIAPLPWLISLLRARLTRSNASFLLGDYHQLNFADYDAVFAYLSPAAMPMLWQKAQQEMRKGSLLMSYEFEIVGVKPSFSIKNSENGPTLYVWKM